MNNYQLFIGFLEGGTGLAFYKGITNAFRNYYCYNYSAVSRKVILKAS
jgi:hypothetical protein